MLVLAALAACGCGNRGDDRLFVAFSQANNAEPYRAAQNALMEKLFAADPDVRLVISDAQQDNSKQVAQVETFIRQKPDLLIVAPNERAAEFAGLPIRQTKVWVYALAGLFSGYAGVLYAAENHQGNPNAGVAYELDAIAAVVIGGTSLSGGAGTILGTIIGAFIMSVLTNGLRILSVAQEWQFVVTGIIIILAVYADMLRKKRA